MSEKEEEPLPEDWTEAVKEYLKLETGETTLQILGEPYLRKGKWGTRLHIPTDQGVWAMNVDGGIAQELKRWARKLDGKLAGCSVTVVRTGKDRDTRYDIKQFAPPSTQQPLQPTKQPPISNQNFKAHLEAMGIKPEAFNQLSGQEQARLLKKWSMQQPNPAATDTT